MIRWDDVVLCLGAFAMGASFGSFLGCAIYRVPRRLSIWKGRSACPACHHQLTAWELIPVVSFLIQRARCRECGVSLSWAYFWAEILCGLTALAVMLAFLPEN